jgi:hypothetical protein
MAAKALYESAKTKLCPCSSGKAGLQTSPRFRSFHVAFSPTAIQVKTESPGVYFHSSLLDPRMRGQGRSGRRAAEAARLLRARAPPVGSVKKSMLTDVSAKKAAFDQISAGSPCPRCGGTIGQRSGKNGAFSDAPATRSAGYQSSVADIRRSTGLKSVIACSYRRNECDIFQIMMQFKFRYLKS